MLISKKLIKTLRSGTLDEQTAAIDTWVSKGGNFTTFLNRGKYAPLETMMGMILGFSEHWNEVAWYCIDKYKLDPTASIDGSGAHSILHKAVEAPKAINFLEEWERRNIPVDFNMENPSSALGHLFSLHRDTNEDYAVAKKLISMGADLNAMHEEYSHAVLWGDKLALREIHVEEEWETKSYQYKTWHFGMLSGRYDLISLCLNETSQPIPTSLNQTIKYEFSEWLGKINIIDTSMSTITEKTWKNELLENIFNNLTPSKKSICIGFMASSLMWKNSCEKSQEIILNEISLDGPLSKSIIELVLRTGISLSDSKPTMIKFLKMALSCGSLKSKEIHESRLLTEIKKTSTHHMYLKDILISIFNNELTPLDLFEKAILETKSHFKTSPWRFNSEFDCKTPFHKDEIFWLKKTHAKEDVYAQNKIKKAILEHDSEDSTYSTFFISAIPLITKMIELKILNPIDIASVIDKIKSSHPDQQQWITDSLNKFKNMLERSQLMILQQSIQSSSPKIRNAL